ncbi:MAG: PilN domain-containing protein [Candidatus Moranbacteria bacterium]|jgi:hypothetical protein|nr:PilN domain-containing protein [Candidatus Moranbacteria bacterium]
MVNINLHKDEKGEGKIYEASFWKSGAFLAAVILFVTVAIYGAQLAYKQKLIADEKAITEEIASKRNSLGSTALVDVKDFDQRISGVSNNLSQKVYPDDILAYIEDFMIRNVYINTYAYDDTKKEVSIGAVADNFNIVASQLLNIKKSEKFSNINISGTNRNEEGKIEFIVTMTLKDDYINPETKS